MARPGTSKRGLTTIEENPSPAMSVAGSATSSATTKLLLADIEILKAELENLKFSKSASRDAATKSLRSRLSLLKDEVKQMKRESKAQRTHSIQVREDEIRRLIEESQTLDLAFVFDATSSMQCYIDEVKNEITKIVQEVGCKFPQAKTSVGFAVYRDYDDELDGAEQCDFTSSFKGSSSQFASALSRVNARGGRDPAEDVFTGLERVAELNWNATTRVLFHIADCPCHGSQFHGSDIGDDYPKGDKLGRNIADLLHKLRCEKQITTYFFCHLGKFTEKMVREFKKVAPENGNWIGEGLFLDVKEIPSGVASVCSKSISRTLSTVGKGNRTRTNHVPCKVLPAVPQWSSISLLTGHQLKHKQYANLDDLLKRIKSGEALDLEVPIPVEVQIAPQPFSSEGATRWPYYAQLRTGNGKTFLMVVKRFKATFGADIRQVHDAQKYIMQMEVQTVSAEFAKEFNKLTSKLGASKQVMFSEVWTLKADSKHYNMEKFLPGGWNKYSNNGGYVNTDEYTATLQAFSHWTHERSRGSIMVTDLQGTQTRTAGGSHEFLLSDPAIHGTDLLRFTRTNLGDEGFRLFYATHKCNDLCSKLRLKPSYNGYTTLGTRLS